MNELRQITNRARLRQEELQGLMDIWATPYLKALLVHDLGVLRDAYRIVRERQAQRTRWSLTAATTPVQERQVPLVQERTYSDTLAAWDTWRGNDDLGLQPSDTETLAFHDVLATLDERKPDLDPIFSGSLERHEVADLVYAWNEWQRQRLAALAKVAGTVVRPRGRTYLGLEASSDAGRELVVWAELTYSGRLGLASLVMHREQLKEVRTSAEARIDTVWDDRHADAPDEEVDAALGYRPDADIRDRQFMLGGQLVVAEVAEDAVLLSAEQVDSILTAEARWAEVLSERS